MRIWDAEYHLKYYSDLDFLPNLGEVNDEHRKRFHQNLNKMEGNYRGKWNTSMMRYFSEILLCDVSGAKKCKIFQKINFFILLHFFTAIFQYYKKSYT